jgi:hypothetical protein
MEAQYRRVKEINRSQEILSKSVNEPRHRSRFYLRNLEMEQHRKEMDEAKKELKQLLFEKKLSYSRYVADIHRPSRNELKTMELENLKERIKHPVRRTKYISPGTSLPLLPHLSQNNSFNGGLNRRKSF